MIDLQTVVFVVLQLLVAGAVLGLLLWLIEYIAGQFPSEPMSLFARFARIVLIVLAVLLLIYLLLGIAGGAQPFRWGGHP